MKAGFSILALSGLAVGVPLLNTVTDTVESVPVVGSLASGVLSTVEDTVASVPVAGSVADGVLKRALGADSVVESVPVVGSLASGVLSTVEDTVASVPVAGSVAGGVLKRALGADSVVDSVPVVGSLASGVLSTVEDTVASVPVAGETAADVLNTAEGVASGLGVGVKRSDITTVAEMTTIVTALLVTVQAHTLVINETLEDQSGTDVGSIVVAELDVVFAAITDVVDLLSTVDTTLTFTDEEVETIAGLVFNIITEIVNTVVAVLATLGVWDLLSSVLANLVGVIFNLVMTIEGVVSGVLAIVNDLISVDGLAASAASALPGLTSALSSGVLPSA